MIETEILLEFLQVISKYGVQNLMYLTHNVRKMWEIKRFKLYECMKQHSKKIFTNICMKIAEDLFPLEEVTHMKMCTDLVRQVHYSQLLSQTLRLFYKF